MTLNCVITVYHKAARNALHQVFPTPHIMGRYRHLYQYVFCQVQQHGLTKCLQLRYCYCLSLLGGIDWTALCQCGIFCVLTGTILSRTGMSVRRSSPMITTMITFSLSNMLPIRRKIPHFRIYVCLFQLIMHINFEV